MDIVRRDVAPSHYLLKIQSYSRLSKLIVDRYESNVFEACNNNWRLILYPTGNKQQNGENYISLYLEIVDIDNIHRHWSLLVNFSLYVFDHKHRNYVAFPDSVGVVRKFDKTSPEWGCDKFLSLSSFESAANGYLTRDGSCIFGVEIFVIEPTDRMEVLSPSSPPVYRWLIKQYRSKTDKNNYFYSEEFTKGGRKWKLQWYPSGYGAGKGQYVSVYLTLNDARDIPRKGPVYTNYVVQVIDQHGINNARKTIECHKFDSSSTHYGFPKFMTIKDLEDKTKGYLMGDIVIVEVEFLTMSMVTVNS